MVTASGPRRGGDLLLVCSSGGHLAQLLTLAPWYRQWNRCWVTFDTTDAKSQLVGEDVHWAHHPTTRNLRNLARNAVLARQLFRSRSFDVLITSGAGVAVPFVVQAWRKGIPVVYIEVYDRIDTPTLTARLCRPFVSRMLVQWDSQRQLYPNATVVGPLL
jgi:UDP-N-acetylglucosamine:LPS N-acetylglucosamine transferase